MDFYKCQHCGNIVTLLCSSGVIPSCCGSEMIKLTENTTDAASEKHVPYIVCNEREVHMKVGSIEHPMQDAHYIEWIAIETISRQKQIKHLHPNETPEAVFYIAENDKLAKAYAFCNLHGLWSASL